MYKGIEAEINSPAHQESCNDRPEIPVTVFTEFKHGVEDDNDTANDGRKSDQ